MLLNCKKKESEVQLKIRRKVAGSCKSLVYLLKLILFLSYFTVCRQMSIGVFALFGTKSYRSQDILTSYADKFHMPYVTVSSVMEKMAGSYELHMKPPLTRVLRDLIVSHNWNNISYVYDSDAGMLFKITCIYCTSSI
jgi:hypothetical protein